MKKKKKRYTMGYELGFSLELYMENDTYQRLTGDVLTRDIVLSPEMDGFFEGLRDRNEARYSKGG